MFPLRGDEFNRSLGQVIFPCTLAGMKVNIKTDIVDSDISPLIKKSEIKLSGINRPRTGYCNTIGKTSFIRRYCIYHLSLLKFVTFLRVQMHLI